MTPRLSPHLDGIRCFACETSHDPLQLLTVCRACGLPLRVDYNLSSVKLSLRDLQSRAPSLWRYRELLPLLPGDEGGAAWSALQTLRASGTVRDQDRVVVFNTGTGLKYR